MLLTGDYTNYFAGFAPAQLLVKLGYYVNNVNRDVHIGDNCFVGAHSIVLPGVTIGDGSIVAAGSVVARNVPAGSLVAGNPARVVEHHVQTTHYGVRISPAV